MSDRKDFKIENGILKKYKGKSAEVTIPEGVVSISSYAFSKCDRLQKVTIPQGVNRICIGAFRHCYQLREAILPEGLEIIGKWAFSNCFSLKKLVIPSSVKQIGELAFYKKMQLDSCVLTPDSKDAGQAKVILSALTLSNLWFPFLKGNIQTNEILEQALIKKMTSKVFRMKKIPLLIQEEEIDAFKKYFSLLNNIRMSPEELDLYLEISLGKAEFTNHLIACRNKRYPMEKVLEMQQEDMEKTLGLREKTLADYRKEFVIIKKNGICTITKYKGTASAVVIPGHIQGVPVTIQKNAFAGCFRAEAFYLEEGITYLPDGAFAYCRNLKKIEIPQSVTHMEALCFHGCYSLREIFFNGTKEEWYAFSAMMDTAAYDIICADGKI